MKKFLENKPQPANEQEFNAMHMNLQRRASSQKRIGKGSVFSVFATDGSDTSGTTPLHHRPQKKLVAFSFSQMETHISQKENTITMMNFRAQTQMD